VDLGFDWNNLNIFNSTWKNGKTGDVKRDAKMIDGKVDVEKKINVP